MECKRALSRPLQYHDPPHSTYGEPTWLNLGKPIFLSHSGKDKDFVRDLHKQLCNRYHDAVAFFDAETLPIAEPVSMENILKEARGSKLGVLVLTEDFFTHTQNPMLELEAFVAGEVPLLPLFFKLSVDQVKEKERRARWEKLWKTWRNVNDEVINSWRHALDLVTTYSGLEYDKIAAKYPSDYIHEIVNKVTCKIPPAISFSGKGICGKDRLCKIVKDMYEECASKRTSNDRTQVASTSASSGVGDTLDVVGIYGFAGLGKTTLCKCLCDSYFAEFNGKVCWVDLGSEMASKESSSQRHAFSKRMQYMLSMLTDYNNDGRSLLQFDQVQNVFTKQFSAMKDPIFLAIDNIPSDRGLREEADFYLSCGFPKGSKIFVTSRSREILENLTGPYNSFSVVLHYIPALKLEEAREIFEGKLFVGKIPELSNLEDEVINGCVEMCTFYRHVCYYHPLMVKSLAASIRMDTRQNGGWKERLIIRMDTRLRAEGIHNKNDAWEMVFDMLDISYTVLSEKAKTLFLDFALFSSATGEGYEIYKWIHSVHPHKEGTDKILRQLEDLCFIEVKSGRIPDLLVDFSKAKVSQGKTISSLPVL